MHGANPGTNGGEGRPDAGSVGRKEYEGEADVAPPRGAGATGGYPASGVISVSSAPPSTLRASSRPPRLCSAIWRDM